MAERGKIPIVAVVGPTASGKTSLAVDLALYYGGEVVSADSMQIYEGMDISTAKPTAAEMRGVPHHLIGFVSQDVSFSVADYCAAAKQITEDIHARGKKIILCGGTGLYISSLLDNIIFGGAVADTSLREELKRRVQGEGAAALLSELAEFDPETAQSLHVNNVGRIIRAIEVFKTTGVTMSEQKRRSKSVPSPYDACVICLDAKERSFLYGRINKRVDKMLSDGLLFEAEHFYKSCSRGTSRWAIGCKELAPYFAGEKSIDEAVEDVKRATRRYAKRQLTWFNKMDGIKKIYTDEHQGDGAILKAALEIIENSGIFHRGASL
ncbi:MAG: tRNA (adenosine(37)-N6)-dimethylallyltransferase MiaA [Clostridiales bacterium]|nr:tRNA (adenosine(37)-N6)-dimethylallyltransferase MiaA [Clostridiales bacterium]